MEIIVVVILECEVVMARSETGPSFSETLGEQPGQGKTRWQENKLPQSTALGEENPPLQSS